MATKKTTKKVETKLDGEIHPTANQDDGNQSTDTSGRDVTGVKTATAPGRGEQLAQAAAEKQSPSGGDLKGVTGEDGGFSVVETPRKDQSDNGKTYQDARISPADTNAPDAGLTPDGRRIAK